MTGKPQADRAAIMQSLSTLFEQDVVIELRAIHKGGRKRIDAGYYDGDHRDALADAAMRLNAKGAAVYVTLNQIDLQLLGRYANRMQDFANDTATDANVTRRRWLLIDLDPVRPKDTAATDAQLELAKTAARDCYAALKTEGWPAPVVGESGNGMHLLYPIDLPNDAETLDLIKGVLAGLAARFDSDAVKVDRVVFNAARITKLYGTVSTKGDHTTTAPWRLSKIVMQPTRDATVTVEQLRALVPAPTTARPTTTTRLDAPAFDLGDFLLRMGIEYSADQHDGRNRFKLAYCPFNGEHGKGEAAIFQSADGKLGFKCQHASCASMAWQDVRSLVDGPKETRRPAPAGAPGRPATKPANLPHGSPSPTPKAAPAAQDDERDPHRNAPQPDKTCLYGLVGEVAAAGSRTTEANSFAIALNFLAYLSAAVGRGPYMPVGDKWHHARIFGLHIGRTSRGRKGDAVSLVHRIDKALRAKDQHFAPQVHTGGLSSREGLVMFIHDGYKEGKNAIEPIHDKRLFVIESEFANILQQGKRDGNTLSSALRDAWDGVGIKPATKSNRVWASNPHIALSCAVTPSELRALMAARELTNGFANRFLMIFAERTKVLPFPKAAPQHEVDALADKVRAVLSFAGADRPEDMDAKEMKFTPKAGTLYGEVYLGELNDQTSGELVIALLERRAPTLLRLAMLFALCDHKLEIDVPHIEAALAWVRFWRDSIKFVFASADDEAEVARTNDAARKILKFLRERKRASRTDLTRDCFQGHSLRGQIDAALDELLTTNPAKIVVLDVPRTKDNPGTATKYYELAANCANSANSEYPCGFRGDSGESELSELCEPSMETDGHSSQVRTVRKVAEPSETVGRSHSSHTSHSSQPETEKPTEPKLDTSIEEIEI